MSSGRGNGMNEVGTHSADPSAKVDPSKDLTDESKAEWMKRRAKEERKHREGLKVVDEWFELINNKKLVKKMKKNNGGVYSIYICNVQKPQNKHVMNSLVKDADGKYRHKSGPKAGAGKRASKSEA